MKRNILIEYLQMGQPKPYTDSIYEAILTYSGDIGNKPNEKIVLEEAKVLIHNFKLPEKRDNPFQAYLESCEKITENSWKIKIIKSYDD